MWDRTKKMSSEALAIPLPPLAYTGTCIGLPHASILTIHTISSLSYNNKKKHTHLTILCCGCYTDEWTKLQDLKSSFDPGYFA